MDIKVFFVSFVLGFSQVLGRSENNFDIRDTNDIFGEYEFKLPTTLKENTEIIINGTLSNSDLNIFSVLFTSLIDMGEDCKVIYDFNAKKLSASSQQQKNTTTYEIYGDYEGVHFVLKLKAKQKILMVTFQVFNLGLIPSGPSNILHCKVDFGELQYIMIEEGVSKVNKIHFKFD